MVAGMIDVCMQSFCAGWAVQEGKPANLEVHINGRKLLDIQCSVERPDLANHGLPVNSGFNVNFDEPLKVCDVVDIRFSGGPYIGNSPNTNFAERLEILLEGVNKTDPDLELGR